MKKLIVCAKTIGNTYKVCSYVRDETGAKLATPGEAAELDLSGYDRIIMASGVYANHPHKGIADWIKSLDKERLAPETKFYLFLTWIGRGSSDKAAFNEMKALFNQKGMRLEDGYAECYGKGMGVIRIGHPDQRDMEKVRSWVEAL